MKSPGRHLVVMVKEPRPGRVKTRLGRDIGMIDAAWWYRHQVRRLLMRLQHPKRWSLWLAVSPDHEGMASRNWPLGVRRIPQGKGNLGDRMARLFRSMPHGPVLIVGSDVPGLRSTHVSTAFGALGPSRAAMGPAPDGGYWLIGLPRGGTSIPKRFLHGVRWSGPHAWDDTARTLGDMRLARLETLADVDTVEDLIRTRRT
jgi:uncharacterized protein